MNYYQKITEFAIISLLSLFIFSPLISRGENLKTGDLIFQCEGEGEFSKAISGATGRTDSLNYVHVGIIETIEDSVFVYEASPEFGVRKTLLDEFLSSSPQIDGKPLVVIKRLEMEFPVEKTIENVKNHIGEPYDWWYLPDNGRMYCSELVYECFIDYDGNKIFVASPMNFHNADGTISQFWTDLFKKLDMEVPQGIEGTNPQDLSEDYRLRIVRKFF